MPAIVLLAGSRHLQRISHESLVDGEQLETFYDLSVEGGQLVIRHRRFGPVPLTHTTGDSFSATLPVSDVAFHRDAQGNVTGFDAGNGRARGIVFKKVTRSNGAPPSR